MPPACARCGHGKEAHEKGRRACSVGHDELPGSPDDVVEFAGKMGTRAEWRASLGLPNPCACPGYTTKATKELAMPEKMTTRTVTVDGEQLLDALDNIITGFQVIRAQVARHKGGAIMPGLLRDESAAGPRDRAQSPTNGVAAVGAHKAPKSDGATSEFLPSGPRAILEAIAQWEGNADDDVIAIATGYKATSRRTYVGELVSRGFIEREGGRFRATALGCDELGPEMDRTRKPMAAELLDLWLTEKLPEGEAIILGAIAGAGSMPAPSIIDATGYKATSVRTYLGELARRRLIVRENGLARLHPELGGPR